MNFYVYIWVIYINQVMQWNIFTVNELQIRSPYNLLLINLAFVEFLIAFVGIPLDVWSLIQQEWGLGKNICIISGATVTTCGK